MLLLHRPCQRQQQPLPAQPAGCCEQRKRAGGGGRCRYSKGPGLPHAGFCQDHQDSRIHIEHGPSHMRKPRSPSPSNPNKLQQQRTSLAQRSRSSCSSCPLGAPRWPPSASDRWQARVSASCSCSRSFNLHGKRARACVHMYAAATAVCGAQAKAPETRVPCVLGWAPASQRSTNINQVAAGTCEKLSAPHRCACSSRALRCACPATAADAAAACPPPGSWPAMSTSRSRLARTTRASSAEIRSWGVRRWGRTGGGEGVCFERYCKSTRATASLTTHAAAVPPHHPAAPCPIARQLQTLWTSMTPGNCGES